MRVRGEGPSNATVLFVGEAPGTEEEKTGRPFIGPAGQLLRSHLQQAGIDPERCFFANLSEIRPPGNRLEKFFLDGGVPNEYIMEGLAALHGYIERIRPNLVVALGNFPLWALTGKARWIDKTQKGERVRGFTGIQDYRGSILPCTLVEGVKVIPTFHPAYILREGMKDHGTFNADLARIAEDMKFPELRRPEKSIVLVDREPQLLTNYLGVIDREETPQWERLPLSRAEIRDILLSTPSVPTTLDIEYIGSKLLCIGLATSRDSAYVLPTQSLADLRFATGIVNETKSFNAQNSMFDASILEWHYGMKIMPRMVFDTMIAAYAANIELPKGLDYLASIYTRQPYYKGMVDWKKVATGEQPLSMVYAYNGIDDWTQHEIMEEQEKWELQDPATRQTFNFMMQLLDPLWRMSRRGVRIDLELMNRVGEELRGEAATKAIELMLLVGATAPFNVRSGPQMQRLLFDQLGFPVLKRNKTGPATDDKTLAALQLQAKNEVQQKAITYIRQIRTAENLQSKFFDIEFDDDGRMRGHYDPTKTVTGRLASRKFYPTGRGTNQQNIPRDKRARRAFIADRGKVFGYADLEKAESFVVAQLTGDPRMLFDHQADQNAHRNLGAALFSKSPEELTEDEYYLSKKTRHAGNYMQGWMTFMRNVNQDAHKTGVSVDAKEAKFFIATYRELHPTLPRWWKDVEAQLWKDRTLSNLIGRHRTFFGHIGGLLPEAVAFTPQSTVGDLLNLGFLNLEGRCSPYIERLGLWPDYADIAEELRDCGYESLQQIHDAVGFQLWEKDVERAVPLIRRALSIPLRNPRTYEDFTIRVEVNLDIDPERVREHRSSWGDAKTYTKDLEKAA